MRRSLLMTQHMIQVCECILKNINWIQWIGVLPKPKWKTINLLPKKFINWSPPFDQHFGKSTHANCWNFILICYCHFLLFLISQSSVEIYGLFGSLFNFFFFFSRQKFLIKDQFEFGLNPHEVLQFFQTLFKNHF